MNIIEGIKQKGFNWIDEEFKDGKTANNQLGSASYLLFGEGLNGELINNTLKKFGKFLTEEFVKKNSNLKLLDNNLHIFTIELALIKMML